MGLKAELSDSTSILLRYMHSSIDDPTSIMVNASDATMRGRRVADNYRPITTSPRAPRAPRVTGGG